MKKIKVCMLHNEILSKSNDNDRLSFLMYSLRLDKLTDKYEFEWDMNKPDYLIIAESIYYGPYQKSIKKIYNRIIKNKPITIFFSGEALSPDMNIYDYAIVFDRELVHSDRIIRMPSSFKYHLDNVKNDIKNKQEAKKILDNKKYFCNFIYSNGNAHPFRDQLFHKISQYKKVDSLGKHLNNKKIEEKYNNIKGWREQSIAVKGEYKFSIASENASFDGYISEKIITSFMAHTIPIYFGDKTISEEYNKKAFIDSNDYDSLDDLLTAVKSIDNDENKYIDMLMQPYQTKKQESDLLKGINDYYTFMDKLFSQDVEPARRIPEGFHPSNYRNSFSKWTIPSKISFKVKQLIKKIYKKFK